MNGTVFVLGDNDPLAFDISGLVLLEISILVHFKWLVITGYNTVSVKHLQDGKSIAVVEHLVPVFHRNHVDHLVCCTVELLFVYLVLAYQHPADVVGLVGEGEEQEEDER